MVVRSFYLLNISITEIDAFALTDAHVQPSSATIYSFTLLIRKNRASNLKK